MPIGICTVCGATAEAPTADELNAAIPGHPFIGIPRCPNPPVKHRVRSAPTVQVARPTAVTLRCEDCDYEAGSYARLAAHTVRQHDREPTREERVPVRPLGVPA